MDSPKILQVYEYEVEARCRKCGRVVYMETIREADGEVIGHDVSGNYTTDTEGRRLPQCIGGEKCL